MYRDYCLLECTGSPKIKKMGWMVSGWLSSILFISL